MDFQQITQFERKYYSNGIKYIAGVDEVGRGPLAGPFVVSAVILDLEKIFGKYSEENPETKLYKQINDSKKVTAKKRKILSEFIKNNAISYSIEIFEAEEVDKKGLSKLTQEAFFQAVHNLDIRPQFVLTDVFKIVEWDSEKQRNVVNGDEKSISVASASIVAKVYRDEMMIKKHEKYSVYGFDRNKGYGTKYHINALKEYGPCEIHRKSFKPVKDILGLI